jgi:hypothetical protein
MAPAVLRRSFRSFSRPEGTTSTNAGRAIGKRVAALTESSALTALTEIPQFCSSKFPTLGRSAA